MHEESWLETVSMYFWLFRIRIHMTDEQIILSKSFLWYIVWEKPALSTKLPATASFLVTVQPLPQQGVHLHDGATV